MIEAVNAISSLLQQRLNKNTMTGWKIRNKKCRIGISCLVAMIKSRPTSQL